MTSADITEGIKKHPIGSACGLLAIVFAGLLYYRSGDITAKQEEHSVKSTDAAKVLANVRNADKLPQQLAEMKALTKEVDSRLVRPGQLAVNLQYFYRLEAETGVKLVDVRQGTLPPPRANAPKTQYIGVPYSVNVQGTFTQVMTFLQKLENNPQFPRFSTVTIIKLGQSSESTGVAAGELMSVVINLELMGAP